MPCFSMTVGQVIIRGLSNLSYSHISCAVKTNDSLQAGRPEICSKQRVTFPFRTTLTPARGSTEQLSQLLLWIKWPTSKTGHRCSGEN
jgi:hypothetical protein